MANHSEIHAGGGVVRCEVDRMIEDGGLTDAMVNRSLRNALR